MRFIPYLLLSGTCRAAFTRYQEILGGELDIVTFGDAPPGEGPPMDVPADTVMNATLDVGGNLLLGSDDPTGDGGPMKGQSVHLALSDEAEAKRVFDALGDGGEVTMPLTATFWSPAFGMCTDRFGVPWMVGVEAERAAS
jgi:PhnB protein